MEHEIYDGTPEAMEKLPVYESPVLYKKDSNDNIRIWAAKVYKGENPGDPARVMTVSGVKGGKLKTHRADVKATATMSPETAAISKVQSKESAKLKSDYYKSEAEAKDHKKTKVMIIHKWDEHKHKLSWPMFAQPKLDGVCAKYVDIAGDPHFESREGNRFDKLDRLAGKINGYLNKLHGVSRDRVDAHGELYVHGRHVSEIIEGIKGSNADVLSELRFYMFDYMDADAESTPYLSRLRRGSKFYNWDRIRDELGIAEPINTKVVNSESEVDVAFNVALATGYEGLVLSSMTGMYQYETRTYEKLKYKLLMSEEFEIIGSGAELQGGDELVLFKCKTSDGLEFDVRPAWSHGIRKQTYDRIKSGATTFLGKMATVEFRGLTKYKIPFHPVLVSVRDYE